MAPLYLYLHGLPTDLDRHAHVPKAAHATNACTWSISIAETHAHPPTCPVLIEAAKKKKTSNSLRSLVSPGPPLLGVAVAVAAPLDLLLQHDAVHAGLEQREHQARLALQLAQPVQDLRRRRAREPVQDQCELYVCACVRVCASVG